MTRIGTLGEDDQSWSTLALVPRKPPPLPAAVQCDEASAFRAWTTELLACLPAAPTREQIERVQLLLTRGYAERKRGARRGHGGEGDKNHICLGDIWWEHYNRLYERWLAAPTAPKPAKRTTPPVKQFYGMDEV